jgi:hypothetical protein
LRGLLETAQPEIEGPRWWRTLPPDIRENAEKPELAYTNFPDLKKILSSRWSRIESYVGHLRKQQVVVHLEELEAIRNDIAHSRAISPRSLALVQGTYYLLEDLITPYLSEPDQAVADADPSCALLAIQGCIHRKHDIRPDLLKTLTASPSLPPDLIDAVLTYSRVLNRPGRSRQLLHEATEHALIEVNGALGLHDV